MRCCCVNLSGPVLSGVIFLCIRLLLCIQLTFVLTICIICSQLRLIVHHRCIEVVLMRLHRPQNLLFAQCGLHRPPAVASPQVR
jgi:hypothetical protein